MNQLANPRPQALQTAQAQPGIVSILQAPSTLEQFAKALPRQLNAERFARIALTEILKNPQIAKCTTASIMSCLVQSAQLGLEPGSGLGLAYLIPYENHKTGELICTLIPGYRGLIKLAHNGGEVKKIESILVHEGDEFAIRYGLNPDIHHIPHAVMNGSARDVAVTHGYAYVAFKDGTHQFEVMTRAQIDAIRDRGRRNPVWNSDYSEMARKTVLRRLCKHIPLSPELADALTIDAEADEVLALPARPDPAKYAQMIEADRDEQIRAREEKDRLVESLSEEQAP